MEDEECYIVFLIVRNFYPDFGSFLIHETTVKPSSPLSQFIDAYNIIENKIDALRNAAILSSSDISKTTQTIHAGTIIPSLDGPTKINFKCKESIKASKRIGIFSRVHNKMHSTNYSLNKPTIKAFSANFAREKAFDIWRLHILSNFENLVSIFFPDRYADILPSTIHSLVIILKALMNTSLNASAIKQTFINEAAQSNVDISQYLATLKLLETHELPLIRDGKEVIFKRKSFNEIIPVVEHIKPKNLVEFTRTDPATNLPENTVCYQTRSGQWVEVDEKIADQYLPEWFPGKTPAQIQDLIKLNKLNFNGKLMSIVPDYISNKAKLSK